VAVSQCRRYVAVSAHNRILMFRRSGISLQGALYSKLHEYQAALEQGKEFAYVQSLGIGAAYQGSCSSGVLDSTPAVYWPGEILDANVEPVSTLGPQYTGAWGSNSTTLECLCSVQ
jgi:hypothetical protein